MNKFWEWMENQKYIRDAKDKENQHWLNCYECGGEMILSKQMLIGYMTEYLFNYHEAFKNFISSERHYNVLERMIEEIE